MFLAESSPAMNVPSKDYSDEELSKAKNDPAKNVPGEESFILGEEFLWIYFFCPSEKKIRGEEFSGEEFSDE
jgi:hypothetical protein